LKETGILSDHPSRKPKAEGVSVPEEPFGIHENYWKAVLLLFTGVLMLVTIATLMAGATPNAVGSLFAIPAILFAYFYRRRGVLIVYALSMCYFALVVLFRYPSGDDIFLAAIRSGLFIAIALIVSFLTAHLVREKRKYHAVFDDTENGVVLISIPDHRILEMNQRFVSTLAMPAEKIRGCTLGTFMTDPAQLTPLLAGLRSECSTPAREIVMRRGDGQEWVAVIAARKIAGNLAVLTFIDITGRRSMERELLHLNADANLYLDILTHDLNNINTASIMYGRLIPERPGPEKEELTRKLMISLGKSDEIIRNVSTLRKIRESPSQTTRIHLAEVIRREMAGYPDARITYDNGDAIVLADDMLSSVFSNLIGNSIKYGGPDPDIAIRVTPRSRDVLVSIEDRGPGIPDSLKPLVFDRFQRGDTSVSGRGLGLFICWTLVKRYGGSILVEDRVPGDSSQGTAIRFTLPRE
jgi:signal transduction histidine kinase